MYPVIRIYILCTLVVMLSCAVSAQKITGHISGYTGKEAYLVMMYAGNQYALDTAAVSEGMFVFNKDARFLAGAYLVVLPPATNFLLLIDDAEKEIAFTGDFKDLDNSLTFSGSVNNTAYYNYLRFFNAKKSALDAVQLEFNNTSDEKRRAELSSDASKLTGDIVSYQRNLVNAHPHTFIAAMLRCELPVDLPQLNGTPEEIALRQYQFQKEHYFDNIDLADDRLVRAPKNVLIDRVDYFLDVLTVQQPDSMIISADRILDASEPSPEAFRFLLSHIFNKYRASQSMGMDAIYVHLAERYIATGKATWISEEDKQTILSAIEHVAPILIGRQAPAFTVQTEDGKDISLYDIDAPYTVLFFWAPNCSHCQQSIPVLQDFNNKYKARGVQVFTVCTKFNTQEPSCWDFIEKNNLHDWINASDKNGGASGINSKYSIATTPKIFVLDKDKKILAKDFAVENLDEVMKRILNR